MTGMAEYIEKEAAIAWFMPYIHAEESIEADVVISDLKGMKAADVEPVVRCRDCKYWGDEDGKLQDSDGVLFARCKVHNYLIDGRHTGWCPAENDFCSCGERKDGVG